MSLRSITGKAKPGIRSSEPGNCGLRNRENFPVKALIRELTGKSRGVDSRDTWADQLSLSKRDDRGERRASSRDITLVPVLRYTRITKVLCIAGVSKGKRHFAPANRSHRTL